MRLTSILRRLLFVTYVDVFDGDDFVAYRVYHWPWYGGPVRWSSDYRRVPYWTFDVKIPRQRDVMLVSVLRAVLVSFSLSATVGAAFVLLELWVARSVPQTINVKAVGD